MTDRKMNNESSVMQALWRKAYRDGRHEIVLTSASDCRRIRFALYNAVRPVRQGKLVDEELAAAAEECSVSIEGTKLIIQAKSQTPAMAAVLESLGREAKKLLEPEPMTAEDAAIAASQERLLSALAAPEASPVAEAIAPKPRVTPYYTRES